MKIDADQIFGLSFFCERRESKERWGRLYYLVRHDLSGSKNGLRGHSYVDRECIMYVLYVGQHDIFYFVL